MKNILVFPCGSEIGLEIHRSLKYSRHFHLIGASSIADHGKFVFDHYLEGLPFVDDDIFLQSIKQVVNELKIDAIYPTMDMVIATLKLAENYLECKVISSATATTDICLSKQKTYDVLSGKIRVPKIYPHSGELPFPLFAKPDQGYGSRGASIINNQGDLKTYSKNYKDFILTEYLPGKEYTLDCFTDRNGQLLFCGPRVRDRIEKGISVNTKITPDVDGEFLDIAKTINSEIEFRGAWFIQLKRNNQETLTLMEVAARLGGSSALYRGKGINFALLSLFDAFNYNVDITENTYDIELDRSFNTKFKVNCSYNEVFVDFDDCIYLNKSKLNTELLLFLYHCLNRKIKITLISKHHGDLIKLLNKLKIYQIFDKIIHLSVNQKKSDFIDNPSAIFIDDSHIERKKISEQFQIPVFSPDMVLCLLP